MSDFGSIPSYNDANRGVRECIIYNTETKEAFRCQYNPTDLPRTRSATYATINAPGMAYPLIQFVSGEVEDVDIDLFFYDKVNTSKIEDFERFIDTLLPPKHNKKGFEMPPTLKFYYGKKVETYVLTKSSISEELLDESGSPYSVRYKLSVRRV